MSWETVKEYFARYGIGDKVRIQDHITDTVEHAAQQIGCEPARIAKTMSFRLKDHPIVIVMAGDARVHNAKYKAQFHEKAAMVHGEDLETLIGHPPGGVCPFCVKEDVEVYLDVSMKRFTDVHAAAGSPEATINLTIEELEKYSGMTAWVDVCKDWQGDEPA